MASGPEGTGRHISRADATAIAGYDGRVATRDPKAKAIPLRELIALLEQLDAATGLEKARLARELASTGGPTIVTLKAVGDEGIWQATQSGMTYEQAREALVYAHRTRISDAVMRHNRRRRGEL